MFTQSIVVVFLRSFVVNARRTEFYQSANISGNLLGYNDIVCTPCYRIFPGIFDSLQLFPRPDPNLQNHLNTLKYYSIIPDSSIVDSNSLLVLLIDGYKFLTLIAHMFSKKSEVYKKGQLYNN
jgi:hypothetical protein